MKRYLLLFAICPWCFANAQTTNLKPVFNGTDLQGWTKYIEKQGLNNDPQNVFKIENGELHVSGQRFGYIATTKIYKDFHLSVQFKWGDNRYPPRERDKRDAGICFNVQPEDKMWPKSIECQIQEGDVGDLWLIDSTTAVVNGKRTIPKDYASVKKTANGERPKGE